ncbi:hypothetical protein [Catellatospora citrea]|uniref:PadR family transcriptional regulator n=1 Tax=Catellatospora citrea TaxID=53366 RepID=A0A8J3K9E7_9ACTN|nr:hypothetical protein [Catellatospora citrea]RKE12154.1 hypothetical protein C8E86_7091 [Catellatospora citrea]GIF98882.1 hypothetical protein Cci01nite_39760 [Catellatospora citrea]
MTFTLEDIVLVLLHQQPSTAFDLQARHQRIVGNRGAVGLPRILAAVNRLRRTGDLVEDRSPPVSARLANRTMLSVTEAGRARQKARLITVDTNSTAEDLVLQGLLALDADRADFDEYIFRAQALLRLRQAQLDARPASAVEAARVAFEREILRAVVVWLHQLPAQRMEMP